jgi:monoamine oxidase
MASGEFEVVVVGGGAAGIAAARRLHDAGVQCLLVEARDRLGGRAWTVVDRHGFGLDLGCGWLHSADRNPWVAIAEAQGRRIDKTPPPWMRPALAHGFPAAEQADFHEAFDAFFRRVNEAADRADCAASTLLEPDNRWNGLIRAINTYISGAALECLSVRDLDNYADSGVNWRVTEGYGAAIAAHAAGVPLALGCPVRGIDHSGNRLKVDTANGVLTANCVVITLPSTVIADETVAFTPALPDKIEAARGLPLGLADKLFLSLAQAEEFEPDSSVFGRTDSAATAAYNLRPFGRPQIEVYAGGPLARELEAGGEMAFFDFAVSELVGLFGSDFRKRVAPIANHCWGQDPFARGSYSFALPEHAGDRATLSAPVDGRLFFAGEACSREDFSTAHGALLSGLAAAEQIIAGRC